MLTRTELVAPSLQNQNAGNSGDLVKHLAYLALAGELVPTTAPLEIVEGHGGKGVYVSAHPHLAAARRLPGYLESSLGRAQGAAFDPTRGMGPVGNLDPGEVAYAGSAALHALLVRDGLASSFTVLDREELVRIAA